MKVRAGLAAWLVIAGHVPVSMVGAGSTLTRTDSIWVAPTGRPGDGSRERPFTSLEAARDAARLRLVAGRGVIVVLRGGDYSRTSTLELGSPDGGTAASPARWVAAPGEHPRLRGARPITLEALPAGGVQFPGVTSDLRAKLRQVAVVTNGATVTGGGDGNRPRVPELFTDEAPLSLARWPDSGWRSIVAVDSSHGNVVVIPDARFPAGENVRNGFLVGYFRWDWSAEFIPLMDGRHDLLSVPRGRSLYGWLAGQRVAVVNHPVGLTHAGQYFFDRASGEVVVWPGDVAPRWLGVLDTPVLRLNGVRHLVVDGITLGWTGGAGVVLENCDSVALDRVAIRYTGGRGVEIQGGVGDRVTRSEIVGAGYSAIFIEAGDRYTLTGGGHVVEDDRIVQAGRWRPTQRSIWLRGVGHRVAHTEIADAEFEAILAQGNDFVLEANHIHHLLRGSRDAGVIYMGRDWSQRGTIIRRNLIHDIGGIPRPLGNWEVAGVYLDDVISGTTITENVFLRVPGGMHIGGGRDNVVTRNAFLCVDPAVFISFRGEWADAMWHLKDSLRKMHPERPPYAQRYPALVHLLDGDPWAPAGNILDSNVVTGVMLATHHDLPAPITPRGTMPIRMDCAGNAIDPLIATAGQRSGLPLPLLRDVGPRTPTGN